MDWTLHLAGTALGTVSEEERGEIEGYLLTAAVDGRAALIELERDGQPVRALWTAGVSVHFTANIPGEVFIS